MSQISPLMIVISIIVILILISIQYTLNLILKEIRAIRLSAPYNHPGSGKDNRYE